MFNVIEIRSDSSLAKFHPAAAACCMTCLYNARVAAMVRTGVTPTDHDSVRLASEAMEDAQELAGRVLGNRVQAVAMTHGSQLLEASFRRGLEILGSRKECPNGQND